MVIRRKWVHVDENQARVHQVLVSIDCCRECFDQNSLENQSMLGQNFPGAQKKTYGLWAKKRSSV